MRLHLPILLFCCSVDKGNVKKVVDLALLLGSVAVVMKRTLILVNWEDFYVLIEVFKTGLLDCSFLVSMFKTVNK